MVTCRCGRQFENSRWDSHVICPGCKRIYANTAPDMFHPLSEDELRWTCAACGTVNDNSCNGTKRTACVHCGAKREA